MGFSELNAPWEECLRKFSLFVLRFSRYFTRLTLVLQDIGEAACQWKETVVDGDVLSNIQLLSVEPVDLFSGTFYVTLAWQT